MFVVCRAVCGVRCAVCVCVVCRFGLLFGVWRLWFVVCCVLCCVVIVVCCLLFDGHALLVVCCLLCVGCCVLFVDVD